MILNQTKTDVEIVGDFKKKSYSVKMTPLMAKMLSSGIYQYPKRAIIRELLANAIDSHTEACNTSLPFIHLPTHWEPYLAIVDNGTGLSYDDCMSLYTTYGESTKTNDNRLIGSMGVGNKSFLSYADSAIIISRFDGVKYTFTAFKDEDGMPNMALLTEEETDEANGLEVRIDVKSYDFQSFENEARFVLQFMDADVNVDIGVKKVDVTKGYAVHGDEGLLMGGILYAFNDSNKFESKWWPILRKCIISMEMGDVEFDPGRERAIFSASLKEKLLPKLEAIQRDLTVSLEADIKSCDTYFGACKALAGKEEVYGGFAEWRGKRVIKNFPFASPVGHYSPLSRFEKRVSKSHFEFSPKNVIVLDKKGTIAKRERWAKANGKSIYILTDAELIANDIPICEAFDPSTIPAEPRSARGASSYCPYYYLSDDGTISNCELPEKDDVWIFKGEYTQVTLVEMMGELGIGKVLIVENKRGNSKGFQALGLKPLKKLIGENSGKVFEYMSPTQFSPAFFIKWFKGTKFESEFSYLMKLPKSCRIQSLCGYKTVDKSTELAKLLKKFPLLTELCETTRNHNKHILSLYVRSIK